MEFLNAPFQKRFLNSYLFPAPLVLQRYLTQFGATLSKSISIPSATADRIVMDIYSPGGVTTGLPTGATTPTANKYETLDFAYSGTIDVIGANGATYVPDGTYIANVKLYLAGELVAFYKLDENFAETSVAVDSVAGNNGTAVNIAESGLFTAIDTGWIGEELVVNGGFDTDTNWVKATGWTISDGVASTESANNTNVNQSIGQSSGSVYRIGVDVVSYTTGSLTIFLGGAVGSMTSAGSYSFDHIPANTNPLFFTGSGPFTGSIDNASVKQLLEYA
ncbi:hypothetical protein [uncultured Amphritea sp.]|uniref:hypothetical protein n=1 Tax=uncultured Amphritea sp. TaxID=981605 RepID=UPI002624FCB5|nr:hypothetical protein [uncultured Amphritea sp.]